MGDHRASIKLEISFHGITDKCDMYINYFDRGDGLDQRIADFFVKNYMAGMTKFQDDIWKSQKEQRELEQKQIELKELARLK